MTKTVSDLMTKNPLTMQGDATVRDAAREMRDKNIGNVLVESDGKLCGIVTDRDLVVRGIANGQSPTEAKLRDLCTDDLVSAAPSHTIDEVIDTMRRRAVRRVPVVENGKAVGVVSLGDLAVERDGESALGTISAAPPTR